MTAESPTPLTPREVAEAQLETYNARDLDAYCALFKDDATLMDLPSGAIVATGLPAIRERYAVRFATPGLRCEVLDRSQYGDCVVDVEKVYADGRAPERLIAIYHIADGKIARIAFLRDAQPG